MLAAGLEAQTITLVAQTIETLRQRRAMPPNRNRIAGLMTEFNIPETRVNVQQPSSSICAAWRQHFWMPIALSVPVHVDTGSASPAPATPISIPVPVAARQETPPPLAVTPAEPITRRGGRQRRL